LSLAPEPKTNALREKGWEAYEFHDRYESYVAIGSFDQGETLADGRVVLNYLQHFWGNFARQCF